MRTLTVERERERGRERRMATGAALLAPLPFCCPASFRSQTLFSRHNPLLLSTDVCNTSAEWFNRAPLMVCGRKLGRGFLGSASRRRQTESASIGVADSEDGGDGWEKEEGELMSFQEMNRWQRNKPAGFGEGKTYDTSIEEKLVEEMERSQKAQVANINNLRSGSKNTAGPSKQAPQQKDIVAVPNGIRVRVCNLPRKKNIHRDLQLAFKGFPGVINISPAVIGNRKTRDPLCKGFAFIDLESKEAADRFVQKYSKQYVPFGKVQKQITCDVKNTCSSHCPEQLADGTKSTKTFTQLKSTSPGNEMPKMSLSWDSLTVDDKTKGEKINSLYWDSIPVDDKTKEEAILHVNGTDGLLASSDKTQAAIEILDTSHLKDAENCSPVIGDHLGSSDSSSSFQKQKKKAAPGKKEVKKRSVNSPTLSVSSSMARLKMKERSILNGVFSKYGGKVAQDLSKQS